jgi:predicted phage terminase large subunit-like protein
LASAILTPGASPLTREQIDQLSDREVMALLHDWGLWARPNQLFPPETWWNIWMLLAGRGFGKTRSGAEAIRHLVDTGHRRIALIAPTSGDARDVMVEGESGLLAISPSWNRPIYEPSKRRLTWPNGAQAFMYSAEEPERLRGPQHDAGWLDELAAWQYPQETWDMYQFGLRLGKNPRTVITTTPKPIPLVRSLLTREGKDVIVSRGSTYENRENLAPSFFNQVAQYEGTRLGRQELHAELIDPSESGIIKRSWIKLWSANKPLPYFEYILQSYDTAFTEQTMDKKTKDPDPSACTTWGIFRDPARKNAATPYSVMILDAWSDWMEYPTLRAKALTESKASFGPVDSERKVDLLLIEDKGSGISLRQDLARVVPIHPYNPGRSDKVSRLHLVSNLFINGLVYLPESPNHPTKPRTWAEPFLEQITSFPQVVHDDYVDTASQALQYLSDAGWLAVDILEKEEYDDDNTVARVNPYAT